MAIEDAIENLTAVLPPEIAMRIGGLITILKALGVFAIIYLAYVIVMGMLGVRARKRMKKMEKKIDGIDKKLDKLLRGKSKKK